jgi:hypothetical protein
VPRTPPARSRAAAFDESNRRPRVERSGARASAWMDARGDARTARIIIVSVKVIIIIAP